MRLCFFNDYRLGFVEGDGVKDVSRALDLLEPRRYPFPRYDLVVGSLAMLTDTIIELAAAAESIPLADVKLLSPVLNPGKVVAAPVNYAKHFDEALADPRTFASAHVRKIQETGLFLKATSSLIGASEIVRLRLPDRRTDHEVELAVIIGRTCTEIKAADAMPFVAGYSIGLDITIRGPEERSLRKSIDTYTVLGPWMVTADEISSPGDLDLMISVNGEMRQRANTRDLILNIGQLIEFATKFYTLEPGDILLTGTPEGVGPINPGDVLLASITGIGSMRVKVA